MRFGPATNVPPSRIRAIAALADEHPGTLRLFVGEDTLPTPDFIKEAVRAAIAEDKTYYTPSAALSGSARPWPIGSRTCMASRSIRRGRSSLRPAA